VVGIGDAENDHAFLQACECSAAVSNALPAVKDQADIVTVGDHGAGVVELIDNLLATDLSEFDSRLVRHHLLLGLHADARELKHRPHGTSILLAGPSASGKSTTATAFMEQLAIHRYQFCVIDPEGDYENLKEAVLLGDSQRPATINEVLRLMEDPNKNLVLSLLGMPLADRPAYFLGLLSALQEMRTRTGRPHWLILDEAHHLLPPTWQPTEQTLAQDLDRLFMITVHPNEVAPAILAKVDTVLAIGKETEVTLKQFCEGHGQLSPRFSPRSLEAGEVLVWPVGDDTEPIPIQIVPGKTERFRHTRKYAEGQLPPERCFYFQGPEGKLNLRAHNLIIFVQMAQGVDEETWLFHLRRGDYSSWFREFIKDEILADEAVQIEKDKSLSAEESLAKITTAVEQRYTLPANPNS
jgi:hypothetical protein